MPMLADAICHTTNVIGEIFGSYYDKVQNRVQQFLNDKSELKYEIDERNSERLTISLFPYIKAKGRKQMPQLHNEVGIYSSLIFYNQFRRKIVNDCHALRQSADYASVQQKFINKQQRC